MKKTLAITFALTSAVAAANAQLGAGDNGLVAGWSFNGIVASDGFTNIAADKSDFFPSDASAGPDLGFFSFDSTFGDVFTAGGAGTVYGTNAGGLSSATDITTRPSAQDFLNSDDFLRVDNGVFGDINTSFDVNIDTTGTGFSYEDWSVSFAAGGDLTIDWSYSIDGGAFVDIADSVISGPDSAYSLNIAATGSNLVLRGTYQDYGLNEFLSVDNFAVYGTAVPEPSTYAAIAGALALGFVAYRRRK